MVGTITARRAHVRNVFAVAAALAISIAVACGGDDPAATTTPKPTLGIVDVPVTPAIEPEVGSDEAAILDVFESMVHAINIEDWDSYVENCNPKYGRRHLKTPAQAQQVFDMARQRIELGAYNRRNVTFRVFEDGTATTVSDEYRYDELVSEGLNDSWAKGDARWYSNSLCTSQPVPASGGTS